MQTRTPVVLKSDNDTQFTSSIITDYQKIFWKANTEKIEEDILEDHRMKCDWSLISFSTIADVKLEVRK